MIRMKKKTNKQKVEDPKTLFINRGVAGHIEKGDIGDPCLLERQQRKTE